MEEEIFCSHSIETYSSYGFAFHMKDGLRWFCWNQCLWTYRIVMSYSPSWYFITLCLWPRNLFCSKWSVATSSYWWNSLVLPSYPSLWRGGMVLLTIQLLCYVSKDTLWNRGNVPARCRKLSTNVCCCFSLIQDWGFQNQGIEIEKASITITSHDPLAKFVLPTLQLWVLLV